MSEQPTAEQPVGAPVDDRPAPRPGPVSLQGRFGRVERLSPAHAGDLWAAVKGHDRLWTYIAGYGPFSDAAGHAQWVATSLRHDDPYFYTIVDADNRAVGTFALMAIRPEQRVVEVGHVVYSPALQRSPLATEAEYLLARYVFETLGYRRYEWKCDSLNAPSRRAALRYGFTFEGIFRQHMISKGRNRDTAWFAMVDGEWPTRKRAFERWLSPENFTAEGKQKVSLSSLNGAGQ